MLQPLKRFPNTFTVYIQCCRTPKLNSLCRFQKKFKKSCRTATTSVRLLMTQTTFQMMKFQIVEQTMMLKTYFD